MKNNFNHKIFRKISACKRIFSLYLMEDKSNHFENRKSSHDFICGKSGAEHQIL